MIDFTFNEKNIILMMNFRKYKYRKENISRLILINLKFLFESSVTNFLPIAVHNQV